MLGATSPDDGVTVTVRRAVGLRTSSLCKDGGAPPVVVRSRDPGPRDKSHGGGAIGGASPDVGVVRPSGRDTAFGDCRGDDTGGAVGVGDGGTDRLADTFDKGDR